MKYLSTKASKILIALSLVLVPFTVSANSPNWRPLYVCEGGKVIIDLDQNTGKTIQLVTYDSRVAGSMQGLFGQLPLLFWYYPETRAHVLMYRDRSNELTSQIQFEHHGGFGFSIYEDIHFGGTVTFEYRTFPQNDWERPKVVYIFRGCSFARR
ncbi:MAG: hypothetical protein J0M15_05620 [Deltaproteobacteria bacterium]|jgi:hypothetical protein|nr:hypothetical protein [Deltaproteobacteria bacterium]